MHLSAHLEPGRLLASSQGLPPMEHCPQPAPCALQLSHTLQGKLPKGPGKAMPRTSPCKQKRHFPVCSCRFTGLQRTRTCGENGNLSTPLQLSLSQADRNKAKVPQQQSEMAELFPSVFFFSMRKYLKDYREQILKFIDMYDQSASGSELPPW